MHITKKKMGMGHWQWHIQHWMGMIFCMGIHEDGIDMQAKFQDHPTPNVRTSAGPST